MSMNTIPPNDKCLPSFLPDDIGCSGMEILDFTMERRNVSPAHFSIKIESLSLLSETGIHDYESREFAAGDYNWKLVIYPEGHGSADDKRNYVSVYLAMSGTKSLSNDFEVNAMFCIFLYNQIADDYLCFRGSVHRFSRMKSIWGFPKLISKESLTEPSNGFLVDDSCIIGAEVFVIKSQRVIECLSVLKDRSPVKHIWVISNYSRSVGIYNSEEFTAGGCKWKLMLYPSGNQSGKGSHVSIYVCCDDLSPHNKVKALVSVCMKDQLGDNHVSKSTSLWFVPLGPCKGWHSFVPIVDMRGKNLVVNDRCIVETEVSVQVTA